jgi:hypothetical protein
MKELVFCYALVSVYRGRGSPNLTVSLKTMVSPIADFPAAMYFRNSTLVVGKEVAVLKAWWLLLTRSSP